MDRIGSGESWYNSDKYTQQFNTFLDQNVSKEAEDNQCCIPFRRSVHFVSHNDVIRNRKGQSIKTEKSTVSRQSMEGSWQQTFLVSVKPVQQRLANV